MPRPTDAYLAKQQLLFEQCERHCKKCDEVKPLGLFYGRPDTQLGYRNQCKECDYMRSKKWTYDARAAFGEMKKTLSCSRCGTSGKNTTLDFHHTDKDTKDFNIGDRNMDSPLVREEMKKCIILCRSCHRTIEDNFVVSHA